MEAISGLESSVLVFIKIAVLIFLFLYIVFAGIVIKQVRVMTETLKVGFESPIKTIAVIHLMFSLLAFFLSILIL